ncbi:Lrp/AsnC family transcriptional regulator [Halorubellus sp. JP-L1]|uniref:Lrp/AsnC family transcriptional regulator n=1 Tax=Halorubellus sp. JP-L1 TaxID=2715753 RepID=UPI00140BC0E3|nr:Lrp/AsnC family transcriptional regulator [Halorubellus sp. JP-L1]NHN43000.1 Lrp/AsnC family transcriptional regulator [Halorubellus sp. JP-L1]
MSGRDLDETDKRILKVLHEDGRATYNEIGERLDITGNTVRRRMDEMREKGIIRKFTVLTDPAELGYLTVAFGLSVEAGRTDEIADELAEHECVFKLWVLSGTHNVIFDARFCDNEQFQNFVHDTLHNIEGVSSYESSIMTRSVADEGSVVLSERDESLEIAPPEEE